MLLHDPYPLTLHFVLSNILLHLQYLSFFFDTFFNLVIISCYSSFQQPLKHKDIFQNPSAINYIMEPRVYHEYHMIFQHTTFKFSDEDK